MLVAIFYFLGTMNELKQLFRFSLTDARSLTMLVLVLGAGGYVFQTTGVEPARHWDIAWGYWANLAVFLVLVGAMIWNGKEAWQRLRGNLPTRKGMVFAGLVVLFFLWFASSFSPLQHRVLSDENSWESMALQMRFHQSGGVCNQGVWENGSLQCIDEVNNFKGKSFAFLQSLVFLVMEPGRDTALLINLPLAALSLLFLYYAVFRWTKNEWTALAAMIFLATMPIYIMQARSASTEVLYVFLLTALCAWYVLVPPNEVGWKHFAVTIPVLALFAQTRQETLFCFIPFGLYYHSFLRAKPWRMALFAGITMLASWPAVNTMAAYRGYDFQGGTHASHSLDNLLYNIKSNVGIMLNMERSADGLLVNPFFTAYTALLLAASAWLLLRLVVKGKFAWGALLVATFSLQIFVILYNVSGTFEIDINQRYVLVALPLFAVLMAAGLKDFIEQIAPEGSMVSYSAPIATAIVAVLMGAFLSLRHIPSYEANILYRKNMLLSEEDYLNRALALQPARAIYIYSRPWQILCMGHNAFSEDAFLRWSPQEFAKWQAFSGGHIYVIRGQDGYGAVDRDSRVVGFKTTGAVEQILQEYDNQRVFSETRPFGYPLVMHRLLGRKGYSPYQQNLSVDSYTMTPQAGADHPLVMRKGVGDTLAYELIVDGRSVRQGQLATAVDTVHLPGSALNAGLHRLDVRFFVPGPDTVSVPLLLFARSAQNALLQDLTPDSFTQSWGTPRQGRSVDQNTLRIDGRDFAFGVGAHANSTLLYEVGGRFRKFHSWIGLDDEQACGNGASWAVRADGKEIYRSRSLTSHEIDSLSLDIAGVARLELVTLDDGEQSCDHTNWAGAWFE